MMFTGHHPVGSGQVKSVNTEIPHQLKRPTNRSEWLPTDRPFDSATTCIGEFHSSVSLLHSSRVVSACTLSVVFSISSPSAIKYLNYCRKGSPTAKLQVCEGEREFLWLHKALPDDAHRRLNDFVQVQDDHYS